jgi:protein-S-isoprenylcysteine O-methyltransferase Ste14
VSLRVEFERTGAWLFSRRSFLALAGLPIIGAGLISFSYLGRNHLIDEVWNVVCLVVSLVGLAVRAVTVGHAAPGTSGRNTRRQVAETLNTTGVYSVVRHPLYLGNYLAVLGMAMFFHKWWIIALMTCIYALYYERIMFAEEAFLRERFGGAFERWAAVTPAILPKLSLWKRPALSFSWRTVLRREYTGIFLVTTVFPFLEVTSDSIAEGRLRIDWPWVVLALFGTATYLILRGFKKCSRLLHEPGR